MRGGGVNSTRRTPGRHGYESHALTEHAVNTREIHAAIACKTMAAPMRILGTLGNGPTRRNLFGPVDRERLQVEYQAALRKDLEEASVRWGFDFIRDKPLKSSDFQWEGITGTKVPLLYRSCLLQQTEENSLAAAPVSRKRARAESPLCDKENIPHSPERCLLDLEKFERTPQRGEFRGLKRKQTNITDFYQAKRRVVGKPRKSGE
ncbi:hypothetical protein WMY93_012441 [Mugilogobius chulae]|uniref:Cyclin-dependent kinase inhibitor domain-containing protein n=1 Tax=Mugilogobius chulae TaxID=88201 RepID=A0AAW0P6N7_9GOBI